MEMRGLLETVVLKSLRAGTTNIFFWNIFFNYSGGDVTLQMSHSVSTERFIAARSSYFYLTHETVLSSVDYHGVLHGLSNMNSLFTRAKWRPV